MTCLGIWSLKGCHASTCSGIHQSQGSQEVVMPRPARDPILGRPICLDQSGDLISRRLSRLSLPGDLHPDPGMPGSQVATVLGRISLRLTPKEVHHGNRRKPIGCGIVHSLSNNSMRPHCLSGTSKRGPSKVYQSGFRLL